MLVRATVTLFLVEAEEVCGGGNCTGEDEDSDEGADDMFHSGIPLKLYSQKRFLWTNQWSNNRIHNGISLIESVIY